MFPVPVPDPWNEAGDNVTTPVLPPGAGVKLQLGTLQQAGSWESGTIVQPAGTF